MRHAEEKVSLRKIAGTFAGSENRTVTKRYRAAVATLPDTLPIVEHDSGRRCDSALGSA